MKIGRKFTHKGESPYKGITFKKVRSEIKNPDGSNFTLNDSSVIQGDEINRKICSSLVKTKYFHYFKKLALSNQAPRMNDFGASSR